MKTTAQWLEGIKGSTEKFNSWLVRQYVGEVNAAKRIGSLTSNDPAYSAMLKRIAEEEAAHAEWVKSLLVVRGIAIPDTSDGEKRYWKPILSGEKTFEQIAAIGHHAETMRLMRIEALANDAEIANDVRQVFQKILVDELGHAYAFKLMSTAKAIEEMRPLHEEGMNLLGLVV